MAAIKTYTTIQGEAWDQVSLAVWGREDLLHFLLQANPAHRDVVLFEAGVELAVPEIEIPAREIEPPWQQI